MKLKVAVGKQAVIPPLWEGGVQVIDNNMESRVKSWGES